MRSGLIILAFAVLIAGSSAPGQTPTTVPNDANSKAAEAPSSQSSSGSISGTIVDQSGAIVAGAHVRLTEDQSVNRELLSGSDGEFLFSDVPPGNFRLAITSSGFGTESYSGTLQPGEFKILPQISLSVADTRTEVQVGVSSVEVAEEQMKIEEKQRVLGIIPNFYVSYIPNAAPLTPKQKFRLAAKTVIDPFTFLVVGGAAGIEQWQNHFAEYGQGAQGYGKRFGAGYADTVTGTFIGGAILPALLKQDPRYFYKGTGSTTSRALYAIANSVICKGDNGRWQPNYSGLLGSLAAGGISNLYYPSQDRNGLGLTFENAGIGIISGAVTNLLQEFVIRKLTPKLPSRSQGTP